MTDTHDPKKARIEYTLNFDEQGNPTFPDWNDLEDLPKAFDRLTKQQQEEQKRQRRIERRKRALEEFERITDAIEPVGYYVIKPPELLAYAAETYHGRNIDIVQKALRDGGANDETIKAVTEDYRRALFGKPLVATRDQIRDALTAISPMAAFNIDRYVLYLAVLRPYNAVLTTLTQYTAFVKNQPNTGARQRYFDAIFENIPAVDAVAFDWLRRNGVVVVSDFAGLEQATIARFLGSIDAAADLGNYFTYYCVCKLALNATEEQLAQINPPYSLREQEAAEPAYIIAERVAADLVARLNDLADAVAKMVQEAAEQPPVTADTAAAVLQQQQEQAREIVRIPENFALILSRDIYTAEGPKANKILPISRYIEAYLQKRGTDAVYITTNLGQTKVDVTPRTVEKAIEGVNLLQQLYKVKPVNGFYHFETNLSEFSRLCGYDDANEEKKLQLLASLMILNNLYLVVWRSNGQHAVQVLNVPEFGISGAVKGNVVINVTAEVMKGRPQLVTMYDFQRLRKLAKGAAKNHYRYQILAKGQMEERALVSQVFGYEYKLDELKDRPAEQKAARDDIRKHRSRDAKTLQKWFDEYAELGFIEYTRTQNAKGEIIYKWRRLKPVTEQERAELEQNKFDTLLLQESDQTEEL